MSYHARLLDALTSNYNKSPTGNIGKLLNITATEMETVKELLNKVDAWRDIDVAEGTTLDRIGKNLNQTRNGNSDSLYRLLLKTAIAKNISRGDINSILQVTSALLNVDVKAIYAEEQYPAKIYMRLPPNSYVAALADDLSEISTYIKKSLAAGVALELVFEGTFSFAANAVGDPYVPEYDDDAGLSDINGVTGGCLGSVFI